MYNKPIQPTRSSLLNPRPRDPSSNNARQRLLPDTKQQPDTPRHGRNHDDRKPRDQEERHTDVLLLTRRTAPLRRLLGAVEVFPHRRHAAAGEAVAGFGPVLEAVFLVAGAAAGAVVRGGDAGVVARVADWEDARGDGGGFECLRLAGSRVMGLGGGGVGG